MSVITRIIKCQEHRNKTLVLKLSCYLQLVQISITCRLTLIIAHEQRSQIIVSTCVCVCVTGKSLLSMSCYYRNEKKGGNHIAPQRYSYYANNTLRTRFRYFFVYHSKNSKTHKNAVRYEGVEHGTMIIVAYHVCTHPRSWSGELWK